MNFGFRVRLGGEDGQYTTTSSSKIKTFTTDETGKAMLSFYIGFPYESEATLVLKNIRLYEGTYTAENIPDYEQYGTSPTSQFPSQIRNTGENGSVNFKVQNKNYLDINLIKAQEGSTQYSAGKVELIKNGFRLTKVTEAGKGHGRFTREIHLKLTPRKIHSLWKYK